MEGEMIVFAIPILGILLGFFGVWTSHKQKLIKLRLAEAKSSGPSEAQAREIEDLRERVRVLERIVTDRGYDLASQIEALRDARRIEARLDASEERGNA